MWAFQVLLWHGKALPWCLIGGFPWSVAGESAWTGSPVFYRATNILLHMFSWMLKLHLMDVIPQKTTNLRLSSCWGNWPFCIIAKAFGGRQHCANALSSPSAVFTPFH